MDRLQLYDIIESFSNENRWAGFKSIVISKDVILNAQVVLQSIDDESIPFIGVYPFENPDEGNGVLFESFDLKLNFTIEVYADYFEQMIWSNDDTDKAIVMKWRFKNDDRTRASY